MLAGRGGDVALLCSGDAAIYGMASLAAEMLDEGRSPAVEPSCRRVALEIIPGISAFQAASAAAGALIGHDFCCISLVRSADPVGGDREPAPCRRRRRFRRRPLQSALAAPARPARPGHRHPRGASPARHAGGDGSQSRTQRRAGHRSSRLGDFDADAVDMLTIVIVGSRQSRSFARGDGSTVAYTPRGYAAKAGRTGMTVHFIGAGPGAPDLITLRGHAPDPAPARSASMPARWCRRRSWRRPRLAPAFSIPSPMHLDEIMAEMEAAHAKGEDVARVHSGDPSLYGAIAEQMRGLDRLGIPYDVTPGRPRLRRRGRQPQAGAHPARGRPDDHPDPHHHAGQRHAAGRGARRSSGAPAPRSPSISRSATCASSSAR